MAIFRPSRVVLAGKGLVFNPFLQMDDQIRSAAGSITSVFNEIDGALDKGRSTVEAVKGSKAKIQMVMHRAIATSRMAGFRHAAEHSKKQMPMLYGHEIRSDAEARALEAGKSMRRTTKKGLKNSPDSDFLLSKERALSAVQFEAGNSYFQGIKDGFRGTGWGKGWYTSAGDSCEDCQSNEDDGLIDVDEVFSSGHEYPLVHLNCNCFIRMARM